MRKQRIVLAILFVPTSIIIYYVVKCFLSTNDNISATSNQNEHLDVQIDAVTATRLGLKHCPVTERSAVVDKKTKDRGMINNTSFSLNNTSVNKNEMCRNPNPKVHNINSALLKDIDAGDCFDGLKSGNRVCLPIALIIGAQKSGTTWLTRHPQMKFSKNNEMHFFDFLHKSFKSPKGLFFDRFWDINHLPLSESWKLYLSRQEELLRLPGTSPWPTTGKLFMFDKTPAYFDTADPSDIFEMMPSVRLILILRQPSTRFHSSWHHCFRFNRSSTKKCSLHSETPDGFLKHLQESLCVDSSGTLVINDNGINISHKATTMRGLKLGQYHFYLEKWMQNSKFIHENLLVLFHKNVIEDPFTAMRKIEDHLGLYHFDYKGLAYRDNDAMWRLKPSSYDNMYTGAENYEILSESREILDTFYADSIERLRNINGNVPW